MRSALENKITVMSLFGGIYALGFGFFAMFVFGICVSCYLGESPGCGVNAYSFAWGAGYILGGALQFVVYILVKFGKFTDGDKTLRILRISFLILILNSMILLPFLAFFYNLVYYDIFTVSPLAGFTGAWFLVLGAFFGAVIAYAGYKIALKNIATSDFGEITAKGIIVSLTPTLFFVLGGTLFYYTLPYHKIPCPTPGITFLAVIFASYLCCFIYGRSHNQNSN